MHISYLPESWRIKIPSLVASVTHWSHVCLNMKIIKTVSCPKSNKNNNSFNREANIWDIEKLGTEICVSMYATT